MQLIIDESTGAAVAALLQREGHDVVVAETMVRASDSDVLQRAAQEGRVLITKDKDFGELVVRLGRTHVGVLLLRLRDERAENRVRGVRTTRLPPRSRC